MIAIPIFIGLFRSRYEIFNFV